VEARREVVDQAGSWNYTVGVGWWPGEKAIRVPKSAAAAQTSAPAPAPATTAPAATTAAPAGTTAAPATGLSLAEAAALQSTIDRLTAENATLRAQAGGAPPAAAPSDVPATPESRAAAQRAAFQRVASLCGDPAGYSDDASGPKFATERLVTFEEGGSRLDARDQEQVRRVAILLLMFPGSTAAIEGHADAGGSVAANQKVTTARAEAVRMELVRLGVPAGALTATGLGSSRPMVDNASAGRLANRRVSIRVTGATIR
jgi:outer membrane protein OmpA-like peptidoglycan-associated protein